jgi:hypothetical protein
MNTEQIKRTVRSRYNHRVAKLTLQEKYTARLKIVAHGGFWHVTPGMIATLSSDALGDNPVILDMNDNPCRIDRRELLKQFSELYETVSNEWLAELEEHNSKR